MKWEGDLDDDCTLERYCMFAHVEAMDTHIWWFAIYAGPDAGAKQLYNSAENETAIKLTTGKMARAAAECCMEVLRRQVVSKPNAGKESESGWAMTDKMQIAYGTCRGCGEPLYSNNLFVDDGCPCNTPRGVNLTRMHCDVCKTEDCVKPAHRLWHLCHGAAASPSTQREESESIPLHPKALAAVAHTTEEDFQHFLSYSGLRGKFAPSQDDLRKAYFHGAGE